MTYTRRTIVSTLRNLFTPRTRRTPGRHRRDIPALELLARLGATATPPVVGRVPRTAGWAPRVHYTCSLDPVTQIIPAVA
jgi:hypothetical protein